MEITDATKKTNKQLFILFSAVLFGPILYHFQFVPARDLDKGDRQVLFTFAASPFQFGIALAQHCHASFTNIPKKQTPKHHRARNLHQTSSLNAVVQLPKHKTPAKFITKRINGNQVCRKEGINSGNLYPPVALRQRGQQMERPRPRPRRHAQPSTGKRFPRPRRGSNTRFNTKAVCLHCRRRRARVL